MACKKEKDPPREGPQKDIGMLITIKVCENVDFSLFFFFSFFYDSIAVFFLYTINYLLLLLPTFLP